jgi:CIC family chloride channel protein
VLLVKFVGGIAAIGGGLTLGREGPTVQMGGAVGQMVSGWFPCTPRERQSLIAAGAGAGLAAAFNAPLSGLVFVLEEVQRDFAPTIFTAVLIASVAADVVMRLLTGRFPSSTS